MGDYTQNMREPNDPFVMAKRLGLIAVAPEPDEIQLDIDSPDDLAVAETMMGALSAQQIPCEVARTTTSKSGNAHVVIRIEWPRPLDPVTRIALQACLGSDRKRELLSLLRHEFQTQHPPTVLFEVTV